MKIILVRCASCCSPETDAHYKALDEGLRSADHRTDLLIIPPLGDGFEALMATASHRLTNLRNSCDVLICLDRIACLLPHGRKFACFPNQEFASACTHVSSEGKYLSNLIEAGVGEAESVQLLVRGITERQSSSSPLLDVKLLLQKLK